MIAGLGITLLGYENTITQSSTPTLCYLWTVKIFQEYFNYVLFFLFTSCICFAPAVLNLFISYRSLLLSVFIYAFLSVLFSLAVWCAVGRHRWFVLNYVINVGLSGSTQPKLERFHHSLQGYPQAGCARGRIGRWKRGKEERAEGR